MENGEVIEWGKKKSEMLFYGEEKAKFFVQQAGIDEFKDSNGWLEGFCYRFGLSSKVLS